MQRYGSIYLIRNKVNDKKYIGQTIFSVETRWIKHLNRYNKDSAISQALDKYKEHNFEFLELCSCFDKAGLNEMEIYFIKFYSSTGKGGYNKTYGGSSMKFTDEVRLKMRLAKLGKPGNNRKNKVNQNGSKVIKKTLHVQRLEGESIIMEYNPSTSPRQPSKYEELKEKIIKLYNYSNSFYIVAEKLNLDKSMVCDYLQKWGLLKNQSKSASDRNKKRYQLSESFILTVKKLKLKGYNISKITKNLSVNRKTVYRALEG